MKTTGLILALVALAFGSHLRVYPVDATSGGTGTYCNVTHVYKANCWINFVVSPPTANGCKQKMDMTSAYCAWWTYTCEQPTTDKCNDYRDSSGGVCLGPANEPVAVAGCIQHVWCAPLF